MKAIWETYGPHVKEKRIEINRPLLYVELEEFLDTNAARYRTYTEQSAQRYAGAVG